MNNLTGIVLSGGRSSRMGSDKSFIQFHGTQQYLHAASLLSNVCDEVYISCNSTNAHAFGNQNNLIIDLECYAQSGPMGGVLSSFETLGEKNLFVLGCDYPFLETADLHKLQMQFINTKNCVAYYSADHNLYEPVIAIYPHTLYARMKQRYEQGNRSLQQFLQKVTADKVAMEPPDKFSSIDTPGMRDEAIKKIKP
ncbi:MAG: molybdenum cofactor guanylyltransferase [Bacteroidetes bacterium]|nr:molybdenum cofactor guanylyltransferase [Bacteroidota bacterium]